MSANNKFSDVIGFKEVINQLPVHLYWYNRDNQFIGCNLRQAQSFGASSVEQIIGQHIKDFCNPDDSREVVQNNQHIMSTGQHHVFEERFTNPQGVTKVFLSHKSPLLNELNEIVGVVGVSQDITRLKNDESEILRQVLRSQKKKQVDFQATRDISQRIVGDHIDAQNYADFVIGVQNYFENIIAIMPGHVYWQDCKGMMLGCNNNQAQTLGLNNRKEIIGEHYSQFLNTQECQLHESVFHQVINEGKTVVVEEKSQGGSGEPKYYYSQKKPIKDEQGKVVGLLGYSLDITPRKQAEMALIESRKKAEIANKAKSEFLMNMSHDLRTPCSGILGFAKILYDQEENPEKRKQLKYILSSSEHLLNLLSEILDYTKVDDGGYTASLKPFDLNELAHDVVELLASELQRKKLDMVIEYPSDCPRVIVSDPVALHRILLNLCGNAVKFTEQGEIHIQIAIQNDGKELLIQVKDTGIGIAEKNLDTIFERFTRLSPSFDGVHKGSGLGLSTVERLLVLLQGDISVSSEKGKGSVFSVTLPIKSEGVLLEAVPEKPIRLMPCYQPLNFKDRHGIHVLVIEDDFISRQVSKSLFESFDADVTIVDSGQEALCEDLSTFDFILTDIGLPDINGFDLVKQIRLWEQRHAVKKPCVIVGLTAHISEFYQDQMHASQLSGLLQKPLTREIIEKL